MPLNCPQMVNYDPGSWWMPRSKGLEGARKPGPFLNACRDRESVQLGQELWMLQLLLL